MSWHVVFVNRLAEEEVAALPADMSAKFIRIGDMITSLGLAAMREPYVKHLTGKLWEMRLSGRDGIARSLYMTASDRRVVVLRTFVKKTQTTPQQEIEIALRRAKEIEE